MSRVKENHQINKLTRPNQHLNHQNCEPTSFSVQHYNNTEQAIYRGKTDQTSGFLRKPSE